MLLSHGSVMHLISPHHHQQQKQQKNSSAHSVAVTWFCESLDLTSSSSSSTTTTISPFLIMFWERVSWLFLRLSLCLVLSRSLGFLKLFSNSPFERLWPPFMGSSLPPGYHKNHLIQLDSRLWSPLELSLVVECLWPLLTHSSLPTWLSRELSDLSGLETDSPLARHADFPFELAGGQQDFVSPNTSQALPPRWWRPTTAHTGDSTIPCVAGTPLQADEAVLHRGPQGTWLMLRLQGAFCAQGNVTVAMGTPGTRLTLPLLLYSMRVPVALAAP